MTGVRMPEGRHFALTWSIPDTFGGMTDALLRRSAAFHRIGGATVDVLTFDARPDTPEIELELRRRGVLVDGVRITNLYDWLRTHPLPGGTLRLERDVLTPLRASDDAGDGTGALETRLRGDVVMSRSRVDADGRTLQVDHYRADGTLLLSDRRDTRVPGAIGGRSVVLCDADGRPVRSWRGIRPLYRAWLDALTEGRPSHLIIDSKTVAPLLIGYRRPHVVTAHVVHASHRSADSEPHPIRRSRREVFEQLDGFDLVVLLSRRQRDDVERIVGHHDHLTVIPNSRPLPSRATSMDEPREPGRGVVLAALTRRKRVSHAIEAVQRANAALGAGGRADPPVHLDVYGDGESRTALERRITDRAAVRLHGFQPDARSRLPGASFLLLTSHSEGFPLVLVEAMAAGCLPIAYDIPYGPADLIRDGRNGFLVPAGDVEALAGAIVRLQRMSPRRVARMRAHAVRTATRFDEGRVTQLWAQAFSQAALRRAAHGSGRFRAIRSIAAKLPLPRPVRAFGARLVVGADRVFRAPGRVG
ncbi:hypothetical protein ASD23_02805 [Agromyces sp. Root1464]|uniref:glycosyltransferase n=1 Tax=Agromyces sp. Root1464 TaxID=1736467 RepID=UPI0006F376B1|nr:glycosyltransferase [Agromyces sp. Root1464]KQZ11060.1 hypothetical protein ASD23_02805 [Agromyces sp. Root1464]